MTDQPTITRTILTGRDREAYTNSLFGYAFPLSLEPSVFSFANKLSPAYTGGYWFFYRLESEQQGFYMAPNTREPFPVEAPNMFSDTVSADAFGIICCLYAYSQLSFLDKPIARVYTEQFHLLREYAKDHAEAEAIFAAID